MYTILVPMDNNEERTQAQTAFLTDLPLDAADVRIVLTHSIRDAETDAPESMRNPDRVKTVRDARDDLEAAGYEVDIAEAGTPPAEGILELASDVAADHIVMGGRKRSPAGKVLFGSVTQAIILDTDVPVTVAGRSESD
jgi:nucleotide-binding universal stress UspA family protein